MSNSSLRRSRAAAAAQLARDIDQPVEAHISSLCESTSMVATATLVGFLRSGIDARMVLGWQLANRGLNQDGVWVGFPDAETAFLAAFPNAREAGVLV